MHYVSRPSSQYETQGDLKRAEYIFADLVRDGCTGLLNEDPTLTSTKRDRRQVEGSRPGSMANLEDALARAMRAAEALDQETEGLQPSNMLDLTAARSRPRSLSLPIYAFGDAFDETAPVLPIRSESWRDDMSKPAAVDATPLATTKGGNNTNLGRRRG